MPTPTYGCHNSERKPDYFVHERAYQPDGRYVLTHRLITDHSSQECRYDFRANDPQCDGCRK